MATFSKYKNSYISIPNRGVKVPIYYKTEVSENKGANYSAVEIFGRSAPLLGYSGSDSRSVSVKIIFFADGINYKSMGEINEYIKNLKATVYPKYKAVQIEPPDPVILKIENVLKIEGVVTDVSVSVPGDSPWDINAGLPFMREVDLSIKEIRRLPLSYEEVKAEE